MLDISNVFAGSSAVIWRYLNNFVALHTT